MSLAARIGRAILWGQAGRVTEVMVFLVFSLLLARVLGPASYGLYALGMGVAGICAFIAYLGLGPETLGRFLPELRAKGQLAGSRNLLLGIAGVRFGAVIALCGVAVAFRKEWTAWIHFPAAPAFIALVLLLFAARSVKDLFTCFSSGMLELRRVAIANLVAAPMAPCLFVVFVLAHRANAQTAWASMIGSALCSVLILATPIFQIDSKVVADSAPLLGRILRFGLFAWAANFFVYILGDNTDALLLSWLRQSRAAIGYYAVGAKIVFSITGLLLGWVSLASVATFSEAQHAGGTERLARMAEAQWKLSALCLIAPLVFLFRYARPIVTALYSAAYAPSAAIIQILSGFAICAALFGSAVQGGVLYTLNHERVACAAVGGAAVFNVASEVFLVRRLGIEGGAIATGLSALLLAVTCAVLGCMYAPARFPLVFLLKISAAALFALAPTVWLRPASLIELGASCAVYSAAFVAALAVLKPLTGQDSRALQSFHGRVGDWAERLFAPAKAPTEGRCV